MSGARGQLPAVLEERGHEAERGGHVGPRRALQAGVDALQHGELALELRVGARRGAAVDDRVVVDAAQQLVVRGRRGVVERALLLARAARRRWRARPPLSSCICVASSSASTPPWRREQVLLRGSAPRELLLRELRCRFSGSGSRSGTGAGRRRQAMLRRLTVRRAGFSEPAEGATLARTSRCARPRGWRGAGAASRQRRATPDRHALGARSRCAALSSAWARRATPATRPMPRAGRRSPSCTSRSPRRRRLNQRGGDPRAN